MKFSEYASPCGSLLLGVNDRSICLCDWMVGNRIETTLRRVRRFMPSAEYGHDETLLKQATALLDEYFAGRLRKFDLPLAPYGTEFQRRVWVALPSVAYGETASYKAIAEAIGCPLGVRAVATAIAANPLSILLPCHRIIGSDNSLTGYAGGLKAKEYLLHLEKTNRP